VLLGEWQLAEIDAETALEQEEPTARTLYNTARIFAQAAAQAPISPRQRNQQGMGEGPDKERRALELLRSAVEKTPATMRASFWKQYVETDPAMRPISKTVEFDRLREQLCEPIE
jgi:regulator of protease activity HflC (stomatin/prohibitin superfamily)